MTDDPASGGGYGRPPAASRFKKGQSGNPRGRPKRSRDDIPYDRLLGQKVTIRDGNGAREVTAAQAFLLHLMKCGMEGDIGAASLAREAAALGRRYRGTRCEALEIVRRLVDPDNPVAAMEKLRMAVRLDPERPTARLALEPWLVEAALARLGDRRLTPDEQAVVVKATRSHRKVRWPAWWMTV